ncbi:MAG: hypothetical protein FDX30_01320 [Chlorobium sp.]|nr:MAG: hypothetical protein FDX30_01320 [Chlorobium sp.]
MNIFSGHEVSILEINPHMLYRAPRFIVSEEAREHGERSPDLIGIKSKTGVPKAFGMRISIPTCQDNAAIGLRN